MKGMSWRQKKKRMTVEQEGGGGREGKFDYHHHPCNLLNIKHLGTTKINKAAAAFRYTESPPAAFRDLEPPPAARWQVSTGEPGLTQSRQETK